MKKMRHIFAIIMAFTMMISIIATSPLKHVSAEEGYEATDSYVLSYNNGDHKWQYFSPYWASWKYEGFAEDEALIAFTLVNTRTKQPMVTYCTDIDTGLNYGSVYRRINLEDSTYHASGAAGVLRSVVLKGFPYTSVEQLGKNAGVEGLTVGEAVNATQAAIWKITHGNRVEFTDFVYYIDTEWTPSHTAHYDECNAEILNGYASEENEALIESHIEKVYNYLISLAPTPQTGKAVSNAAFIDWSQPTLVDNGDGTYDVTVNATVNVQMTSNDTLTLSAVAANGVYESASLSNGTNEKTLTIENVPADIAKKSIKLAIDGTQTVADVFLFDAEGKRGASQSLVGYDDSQLPVHAEIEIQPERIINFYKTALVQGSDDGYTRVPLEGIEFDIYLEATLEDYESGKANLDYKGSGNPTFTVSTDENGRASLSLTKNNLPDGVYLIVERSETAIRQPVDPFYVVMPATNAQGNGWVYEITIEPKNEVVGSIDIEKDVISIGNDEASLDAYETHTWIIGATVPLDIKDGKEYVIKDTLDNRLDYVGNLKVQLENTLDNTVEPIVLTEGTDYVLTVKDNDPTDSFTVALTKTGMNKIGNIVGSNTSNYMIRVYFDAQINANAEMGTEIPNQATLEYTNSVNFDYVEKSDIPVVYTGGSNLLKVDANSLETTLPGAIFEVYRPATVEELADETIEKVTIKGYENTPMVRAYFYDNAELTGEKVNEVTSDENGKMVIYGLTYGTYYIVEKQAPEGYNLSTTPIEITIDADSHTDANIIKVTNNSGFTLPETGGNGTTFTMIGFVMILVSGVFLVVRKRMEFEN